MAATRDEFRLIGFMYVYMAVQVLAPLFLIGLTVWAVTDGGLELSAWGPLVLAAFAAWALWEVVKFVKWYGFTVVVTDQDITVGKRNVAWSDVTSASVRAAIKFDTWIEIEPRSGERLKIPAAIGKKDQLLTLVEKHQPAIVKR